MKCGWPPKPAQPVIVQGLPQYCGFVSTHIRRVTTVRNLERLCIRYQLCWDRHRHRPSSSPHYVEVPEKIHSHHQFTFRPTETAAYRIASRGGQDGDSVKKRYLQKTVSDGWWRSNAFVHFSSIELETVGTIWEDVMCGELLRLRPTAVHESD